MTGIYLLMWMIVGAILGYFSYAPLKRIEERKREDREKERMSEAKKYTKKQVLAIVSIVFEEILEELNGMKEKMIQQVAKGMD